MSYIGENNYFSFRDGYCETLPDINIGTSEAMNFGRIMANIYERCSLGCDCFSHNRLLHSMSSGIAESGRDACICENTDLQSFKFSLQKTSADCGIYVSGRDVLKIYFFDKNGFLLKDSELERIMLGSPALVASKRGKVTAVTSFRDIYTNSIKEALRNKQLPFSAGVSCGNESIRTLWETFFRREDDSLIFQISDNGQRVNAYSSTEGFISCEKLILAYSSFLSESGQIVWLPDELHFAADMSGLNIRRFSYEGKIPDDAVSQRFLSDPLFMCVMLSADKEKLFSAVRSLPELATVRRDITVTFNEEMPLNKIIAEHGGRIIIRKSGRSRLSLVSQACSAETASEICSDWTDKLTRLGKNNTSDASASATFLNKSSEP